MGRARFTDEMESTAEALAAARHRFQGWLASEEVDAETFEDLAVVMSELGANAVTAAATPGARIEVRAWREGTELVVEVENAHESGGGGVVFHNDSDPLRGYGQGLLIVSAYSDSVEVIPPDRDAGLVVRCRKELSSTP